MNGKGGLLRAAIAVAAAIGVAATALPVWSGDLSMCATPEETQAFRLRHLQSRLMVAGLACNQSDAYNNFVDAFRSPLADAGARLIAYFKRTGGGQPALNRHITELANIAGLYRAADPQAFCGETWSTFLRLADAPAELEAQALARTLKDAGAPAQCAGERPSR